VAQLRLVQSHFPIAPCNCSVVLHASNTCSPTSDTSWKSCPQWSTPQPSLPSNCLYTAAATPFFVYHGGGGRTPTGWPHIAPLSQKGWMHLTCSTQHIQASPSAGPPNQSFTTPLPAPEHWSNLEHPVKVSTDGHLLVQLGALRQAARAAHVVKPAVKHSTTKPVVKNKYLIGEFSLQGQLLQLNSTFTSQAIDCTPFCTVTILFFLFFMLLFNQNTIQSKGSDPPPPPRRSSLRRDEEGAGVRLSLSTTSRPLCCHQKTVAPLLLAPAMSLGTPPPCLPAACNQNEVPTSGEPNHIHYVLVYQGGRTPTCWPHTAQSGKPDCRGP
jgi:hypothetical protein